MAARYGASLGHRYAGGKKKEAASEKPKYGLKDLGKKDKDFNVTVKQK